MYVYGFHLTVHAHVCMCVYVCVFECMYMAFIWPCLHIYVCMCVFECIYVHTCDVELACGYLYDKECAFVHACLSVCIHVHVQKQHTCTIRMQYTHTHKHTIHTHIHTIHTHTYNTIHIHIHTIHIHIHTQMHIHVCAHHALYKAVLPDWRQILPSLAFFAGINCACSDTVTVVFLWCSLDYVYYWSVPYIAACIAVEFRRQAR
jgi:hypothetical protein